MTTTFLLFIITTRTLPIIVVLTGKTTKMYNPKNEQFDEQFGLGASMVLTALYFDVKNKPECIQYSALTSRQLSSLATTSPRTTANILDRMEAQDLIKRDYNGNYRSILVNLNKLPEDLVNLCENNAKEFEKRAYATITSSKMVFA